MGRNVPRGIGNATSGVKALGLAPDRVDVLLI
jgi:hypothetical protein